MDVKHIVLPDGYQMVIPRLHHSLYLHRCVVKITEVGTVLYTIKKSTGAGNLNFEL